MNENFVDFLGSPPNQHPFGGYAPPTLWGRKSPNTARPFTSSPVGTTYRRHVVDGHYQEWVKVKDDKRADDWHITQGIIRFRFTKADMTDGGGTSGTYTATGLVIPEGAFVQWSFINDVTAFSGDTTAVAKVGDAGDDDRYGKTAGASVFASISAADGGGPAGTRAISSASTPVVTVVSSADFTNVASTGAMTVTIIYTGGR